MEFIETYTFTRLVTAMLSDDELRDLQNDLLADPARGDLIKAGVVSARCVLLSRDAVRAVVQGLFTIGLNRKTKFIYY